VDQIQPPPVDLDDTSHCPSGPRCESCGAESGDVSVHTVRLDRLGVACLSLCGRCAASTVIPPVTVGTGVRLVQAHCQHLGIVADAMDATLTEE
jgi:hypothetical protein